MAKEDFFEKMLNDSEDSAEKDLAINQGHQLLLHNLEALLEDARNCLFHDFHKNGLVAPKMALKQRIDALSKRVVDGAYDN